MTDQPGPESYGPRADLDGTTITDQVRLRREEIGLSQGEIAELGRVSRGTVRNVELGKAIGANSMASLGRALGWRTLSPTETPWQHLRAGTVRGIGQALLDERYTPDPTERAQAVADFDAVIAELAADKPILPNSFGRLMTVLRWLARPVDVHRFFEDLERAGVPAADLAPWRDRQATPTTGDPAAAANQVYRHVADQQAHARALERSGAAPAARNEILHRMIRGNVTGDEAFVIARSGLDDATQDGLSQWVSTRREQFNADLMAQIRALLDELRG